MTYTYIGYGTTNSNGIAKLDHDANGNTLTHSYTGTGAGKIDIIASLDSTITENSITSNTYELLDCITQDPGTQQNNKWTIPDTITKTVTPTGTKFSAEASTATTKRAKIGTITTDAEILITVKTNNVSSIRIGLIDSSNSLTYRPVTDTEWTTYKIRIEDGTFTLYKLVDDTWTGVSWGSNNADPTKTLNFLVYLYNRDDTAELTFKDLLIYPI